MFKKVTYLGNYIAKVIHQDNFSQNYNIFKNIEHFLGFFW